MPSFFRRRTSQPSQSQSQPPPPPPYSPHAPSTLTLSSTANTPTGSIHSSRGTKRYDFARGFIKDTITILHNLKPIWTLTSPAITNITTTSSLSLLSTRSYTSSSKQPGMSLRVANTNIELANIHPHTIHLPPNVISATKSQTRKIRVNRFLRKSYLGDDSLIFVMNVPVSECPIKERLFWRVTSDEYLMTLYAADGSYLVSLATAYFSQSSSQTRLIAIEIGDDVTNALVTYIIISAAIIERQFCTSIIWGEEQRPKDSEFWGWLAAASIGMYSPVFWNQI